MTSYYFIDTDVRNTRAHTSQILNTVVAINSHLPLTVVAPRYARKLDLEDIQKRQGLTSTPHITLLLNFGLMRPGTFAFVLFNIPAILFLAWKKISSDVGFIYIRSTYLLPLAFAAFLFRVPCFYETHREPLSPGERWRDDRVSRIAAGIIIISAHMRQFHERFEKPILVAHDAVSLERFSRSIGKEEARAKLALPHGARICVYAGTVSRLKGCEVLIGTAEKLPNVTFLLVGQVLPEIREMNIPGNVRLVGRKEQEEVPAYLEAADVLILPHPKGEYSQSPMKLFEYMASSVPIVASRLPSITEVLNDENSALVEPENQDALAAGIRSVFDDPIQALARARTAKEAVRQHTWESRGASIADFIQKTLA